MQENKENACLQKADSQNFILRLSDSFISNDTSEKSPINNINKNKHITEVIILSDSSDDEHSHIFDRNKKIVTPPRRKFKNTTKSPLSISLSSIDTSEIFTDDEEKNRISLRTNKIINSKSQAISKGTLMTSIKSGIDLKNIDINKDNFSEINLITPTKDVVPKRGLTIISDTRSKQIQSAYNITPVIPNIPRDINKKTNGILGTPNSAKLSTRTTPLTKKDTRDIMKALKSKRAVYDSPGKWQKYKAMNNSVSDTSPTTSDCDDMNKREKKITLHPAWIDETESESGESQIQNDIIEGPKPREIEACELLDPPVQLDPTLELSDSKKLAISRWLLTSPLETRTDSSLSIVPPSERNSLSSGNSSLDRLEEKYETPNNRDKFHNKITPKPAPISTRSVQSAKLHQTTMDSFVKKFKRNKPTCYTPLQVSTKPKRIVTPPSIERANIQIDDCADILDKLYGDTWRAKANVLLPNTEPRKKNVQQRDAKIHNERKVNPKSKKKGGLSGMSSLSDDGFNNFVKNIKPHLNSTKKPAISKIKNKPRDPFINDDTCSEVSGGETTFLTALTAPRFSNKLRRPQKDTPISLNTQKAIEICDSDTDDDDNRAPIKKNNINRRKLVYSDDENDSSPATSEYDPEDVILPKPRTRMGATTSTCTVTKSRILPKPVINKSFLASLSASVPLAIAHPDAKKYRNQFKTTKEELCKYLYKLYNDKIFDNKFPEEMSIEWNVRMRGTAGFCYNKSKKLALGEVERSSRIVLATKIIDTPDRLRDTLVHEMCHAATWLINEISDGHGPFWQTWASKAMKTFPELPPIKRCHDYQIATKYTYRCVNCGYR